MARVNHMAKMITDQRQRAAEVACVCVKDTLYVVSACIAAQLYERGYKRKGIERFMEGVMGYIQEFVDNAKGDYIDKDGYTKHRNLEYATKRIVERQHEIIGDEPLIFDISELIDLLLKR
jgi:hypothetical protein